MFSFCWKYLSMMAPTCPATSSCPCPTSADDAAGRSPASGASSPPATPQDRQGDSQRSGDQDSAACNLFDKIFDRIPLEAQEKLFELHDANDKVGFFKYLQQFGFKSKG